nr:MAG: RNA-dependent RNA polymerase [Riboviria sp.]
MVAPPEDIIASKIARNTMVVEAVHPTDPVQRHACMIFAVVGRKALMPWHYVSFFDSWKSKGYNFTLHTWPTPGNVSSYSFDPAYFMPKRVKMLDLCTIDLPAQIAPVPSTIGIFSETRNAVEIFDGNATLYTGHDSKNAYKTTPRIFNDVKFSEGETSYDNDNKIYLLGYSYPFSQAGACMSVLVDNKTKHILGFHTTGNYDRTIGYATVCVRDMIKHLLPQTTVPEPIPTTSKPIADSAMLAALNTADVDVSPVCAVPSKMALRTNVHTNIEPTIMSGVLSEPVRFPAILSEPTDNVPGYGPLAKAVKNEFAPYKSFPKEYVDIAANDLTQQILVKCTPTVLDPQLVRSQHEAIAGVPGVAFCEGLKLNTSAGWPLCSLQPGSHKSTFIETDEQRSFTKVAPILAEMLVKEENLRKEGVIPFSVYADFGKDERVKPGKNMRLINGCPVSQTILWRRYCMDFFSAFQNAQIKVGSAIGINPFGTGMHEMAQHLLSVGPKFL